MEGGERASRIGVERRRGEMRNEVIVEFSPSQGLRCARRSVSSAVLACGKGSEAWSRETSQLYRYH